MKGDNAMRYIQATTVAGIVMTTTPIAVTVGTLTREESIRRQKWRHLQGWRVSAIKTTTVTGMVTSSGSIPVTVGTFET